MGWIIQLNNPLHKRPEMFSATEQLSASQEGLYCTEPVVTVHNTIGKKDLLRSHIFCQDKYSKLLQT
jgi:hypothetical protein